MGKAFDIGCLWIRTGATAWDCEDRVCGQAEVPLCPAGRAAVLAGLQTRQNLKLSAVLCGPEEASIATAELVAGVAGCKVRPIQGLQEMGLGLWEGMLSAELRDKCPRAYRQWIEDPASVTAPEGETATEAQDRVVEALQGALAKVKSQSEDVGIVMRPIVLGLVKCWLSGEPISRLWSMTEDHPAIERLVVPRSLLSRRRESIRAGR
jgi:broad specificity phosphatase PhoE